MLIVLAACKGGHRADYEVQAELQMIDTLQSRLLTVKSWIDQVNWDEMQERKDIIEHNLHYIEMHYTERGLMMDPGTAQMLDEYKTFGKLYKKASDSFKPIVTELEELLIQLKTLKASAYEKDYEKETFLKYFHKEKEDITTLYNLALNMQKPVVDTNMAFDRTQKRVEELAEELKLSRPPMVKGAVPENESEED